MTVGWMVASVSACGFEPLYPQDQLSQIRIDLIPERSGQSLRTLLASRFYPSRPPESPLYRLRVDPLEVKREPLFEQRGFFVSRIVLTVTARYTLSSIAHPEQTFSQSSQVSLSYLIDENPIGSVAAEQEALDQALILLHERITRQITLILTDENTTQAFSKSGQVSLSDEKGGVAAEQESHDQALILPYERITRQITLILTGDNTVYSGQAFSKSGQVSLSDESDRKRRR